MVRAGWRADEGEIVVRVLKLCIIGIDLIYQQRNSFVVFVAFDGPAYTTTISASPTASCRSYEPGI